MTLDSFLQKAKLIFGNKYDYSLVNYINNKTKVIIICNIHGLFSQVPSSHLRGSSCPLCSRSTAANKHKIKSIVFFERVIKNHNHKYDYSKSIFKGLQQKITVICPKHGSFTQRASAHLKSGCVKCRNDSYRLSIEQVINKAKLVHNSIYDYSNFTSYKNNKQKIHIICKLHGSFYKKVDSHLAGLGCTKCSSDDYNSKLIAAFISKANTVHNNQYSYLTDKNFSSNKKVIVICNSHGKYISFKWSHLKGSKCPKCVKENRKLSVDEFLSKANEVHSNKYDYSESKINFVNNKIKIICHKHGSFWQRTGPHIYAKHGCPNCSKIISKSETEWLDYIKLPYEFRNKHLKINNKSFFPDGFDPVSNTLYEYYGDYWHGNLKIYDPNQFNKLNKITFKDLHLKTMDREEFIKSHGYNIVSIWESEWSELKKILNEKS